MKQIFIFITGMLLCTACVKVESTDMQANPAPVISFFKGNDPWTSQPTFIYSDTTIAVPKSYTCRVQFTAAATLRHVLAKQGAAFMYEKEFENDNYYNHQYQFTINPEKTTGTFKYEFEALDWDGKSVKKTLTVIFP